MCGVDCAAECLKPLLFLVFCGPILITFITRAPDKLGSLLIFLGKVETSPSMTHRSRALFCIVTHSPVPWPLYLPLPPLTVPVCVCVDRCDGCCRHCSVIQRLCPSFVCYSTLCEHHSPLFPFVDHQCNNGAP